MNSEIREVLEQAQFELGHIHQYLRDQQVSLPITLPSIQRVVERIEALLAKSETEHRDRDRENN